MMSASYMRKKIHLKRKMSMFGDISSNQVLSMAKMAGRFPGGVVCWIPLPFDEVLVLTAMGSSVKDFFDFILLVLRARDLNWWW